MAFSTFRNGYKKICEQSTAVNPNEEFMEKYNLSIDLRKTDKYLSDSTLYAIWWFWQNGFSGMLTKNNSSTTIFTIFKNKTSDTFELTATKQDPKKCNIKLYMEQFAKSFAMKQEIERLKALKNS